MADARFRGALTERRLTRSRSCSRCTLCDQSDEPVRANHACTCGYALCAHCIASLVDLDCPNCRRVLVGVPANPLIRSMVAWSQDAHQRDAFLATREGRAFVAHIEAFDVLTDAHAPGLVERLLVWMRRSDILSSEHIPPILLWKPRSSCVAFAAAVAVATVVALVVTLVAVAVAIHSSRT
jgi:hypothetical protein